MLASSTDEVIGLDLLRFQRDERDHDGG